MTNTTNVPINATDQWVEVATGEMSGVVSVTGGGQHCIQEGIPDNMLIGHRFTGYDVPFTLALGESLYVRCNTPANAVVTGD